MAERNENIDKIFRDKLATHSVNPSPKAWEKLEDKLSEKEKGAFPWMRTAASITLLVGLAALIWLTVPSIEEPIGNLADKAPTPEVIQEQPSAIQTPPDILEKEENEEPVVNRPAIKKLQQVQPKRTIAAKEPAPINKEITPVQELEPIELPPLDTDLFVAESDLSSQQEEAMGEVAYKVTIISKGIKATSEKETLVGEIENKIDKIGGLIGKVDQGFADLQDAKNNLFASITTKK